MDYLYAYTDIRTKYIYAENKLEEQDNGLIGIERLTG